MIMNKENDDSNSSKELSLSPSSSSHSEMNNNSYQEDTIQTMYEKEEKKISITPKQMFFRNIDMLISHLSKEESDEEIEEVDDYNNELYKEKKELQEEIRKLKVAINALEIPIVTSDVLIKCKEDYCILITNGEFYSVMQQLNQIDECKEMIDFYEKKIEKIIYVF